jgi:hypothetical protein
MQRIAALALFLLASCGTDCGYVQPIPSPQSQPATIIGARYNVANPLSPNVTLFVVAIDGQMLGTGWQNWDQPVTVTPGDHQVEFSECFCSALSHRHADYVAVEGTFAAGKNYLLTGTLPRGPNLNAFGWIADANGNTISKRIPLVLARTLPSGLGETVMIPIFLH